jgi:2-polyprenyl-6-methoxyphenol hydroxylase-like FAD-dependent oxidoreductase
MSRHIGGRAIVIGAGIGGLAAGGALAPFFQQVVILERDRLPDVAETRAGAAQGRHTHGLLAGGLKALDEIFPGYRQALVEAGAITIRVAQDVRFERADIGALPQRDLGISYLCASRPLIELVLRRQLESFDNVKIWPECKVTEILSAKPARAAHGVRFDMKSGEAELLHADLVVDASGRPTLTMALLEALRITPPAVTEIGVDINYATAIVDIPAPAAHDWKMVLTQPNPPKLARYGVLLPVESGRWMVTICRHGHVERLDSWEKFLGACRELITPTIYDALRPTKPIGDIRHHGFSASSWRHFEKSVHLPRGLLPIADSLCRFNPIHGQGMSSAALQARLLRNALERASVTTDPIAVLQDDFLGEVSTLLETPWGMAANADLAFPETRGVRREGFEENFRRQAATFRAAVADPVVHKAMVEVAQLLQPRTLLQEPHIARRIEELNVMA